MRKQVERHAKQLQSKGRTHEVAELAQGIFDVTSGTSGKSYRVCVGQHGQGASCSCDWGKYRPANDKASACSHTLSVYSWLAEREGRRVSAWSSDEEAKRQHKAKTDIGDGVVITKALR